MKCIYMNKCNCYSEDSYTCNKEPCSYCGKFRQFEEELNNIND